MRVLFVVPYPLYEAPSQRFRMEHYLTLLNSKGISWKASAFWSLSAWRILFKRKNKLVKAWWLLTGFVRRFFLLFRVPAYEYIYIHREATPLGFPWFEWCTAKLFRKKIIYDFDDAIWISVTTGNTKGLHWLKNFGKVASICRWSNTVTVGNEFLAEYARKSARRVIIIPTVVDTEKVHNKMQVQSVGSPGIGWTGTFSTLKYLELVLPVIRELQEKYHFDFTIIADRDPELDSLRYKFKKWNKFSEVDDLLSFHIGIMPLTDDDLSSGKCGFKAIQYMSLGMPALVSPVGVNTRIVDNGVNGFICHSSEDWTKYIGLLLENPELRERMGIAARKKIESEYSVTATVNIFLSLFQHPE